MKKHRASERRRSRLSHYCGFSSTSLSKSSRFNSIWTASNDIMMVTACVFTVSVMFHNLWYTVWALHPQQCGAAPNITSVMLSQCQQLHHRYCNKLLQLQKHYGIPGKSGYQKFTSNWILQQCVIWHSNSTWQYTSIHPFTLTNTHYTSVAMDSRSTSWASVALFQVKSLVQSVKPLIYVSHFILGSM